MKKEESEDMYRARRETLMARLEARDEADRGLFLKNAFLFHSAAERILSDADFYRIRIPYRNHMGYFGAWPRTSLGACVKWWQTCKDALILPEADVSGNGKALPRLLFWLSGSPLSGMNVCASVDTEGTVWNHGIRSFKDVWNSLHRIPFRPEGTQWCDPLPYRMCDVVRILRADPAVMAHYEEVMQELGLPERGELSVTTAPPSSPSCHRSFDEYDEE